MNRSRQVLLFLLIVALLALTACQRQRHDPVIATGYVATTSVNLRDKVGAKQITVATLKQGDRLEILRRFRRMLLVRTATGQEGWLEEKHIVTQEIVNRFDQLRNTAAVKPSQGTAKARREATLRLEPNRKAPGYFVMKEEESCEVVGRASSERPPRANQAKGTVEMEDWFLVRTKKGAGWVFAANFDMAVPEEVLQYAEGKRVVAWFVLDPDAKTEHPDPDHPTILWATTSGMGLPYDFDSLRVFLWVARKNHYETGMVEHNLHGYYPIVAEKATEKTPPGFIATYENRQGEKQMHKFSIEANRVKRGPVL